MKFFRYSGFNLLSSPHCASRLVIAVIAIAMFSACGKKGPVRPKIDTPLPSVREVTLQQQGNHFLLGWTIPAYKESDKVQGLTGFRINRLTYDSKEGCPTCREPQDEVAELDIAFPDPAQRIGKRIYWRDLDILPGNGYRYAIVPLALGNQEGPAATIHLAALAPLPSPSNLQATAGDGQATLQWTEPALSAEVQLVGYNLYRRQVKRPFPMVPLNNKPLETTRLLDRGLDNGRAYEYRVSAVVRIGDQVLESLTSPGTQITPLEGL
jgi:hypothetical protein